MTKLKPRLKINKSSSKLKLKLPKPWVPPIIGNVYLSPVSRIPYMVLKINPQQKRALVKYRSPLSSSEWCECWTSPTERYIQAPTASYTAFSPSTQASYSSPNNGHKLKLTRRPQIQPPSLGGKREVFVGTVGKDKLVCDAQTDTLVIVHKLEPGHFA